MIDVTTITNRMIAERVGWKTKPSYQYDFRAPFHLALGEKANGVGIYTPAGEPVADTFEPFEQAYHTRSFAEAVDAAWAWATQENLVPDYLHSADVALTLLPLVGGEHFSWNLRNSGIDLTYVCEINDFVRQWRGEASTPAEAICRAWWAWQESQSHHNP